MVLFRERSCSSSGRPWRSWPRGSWSWSTWSAFTVRRKTEIAESILPGLRMIRSKENVDILRKCAQSLSRKELEDWYHSQMCQLNLRVHCQQLHLDWLSTNLAMDNQQTSLRQHPPTSTTSEDYSRYISFVESVQKPKCANSNLAFYWGFVLEYVSALSCCHQELPSLPRNSSKHTFFFAVRFLYKLNTGDTKC